MFSERQTSVRGFNVKRAQSYICNSNSFSTCTQEFLTFYFNKICMSMLYVNVCGCVRVCMCVTDILNANNFILQSFEYIL